MALTNFDIDGGAARSIMVDAGRENKETPRWLFCAADFPGTVGDVQPAGGIDFGSICIVPPAGKLGFMNRCLVTPMVITWHPYNRREVPEGMRVREVLPGKDVLGKPTDMVHIPALPGPEFENLMRGYAHWGIREIEALRGKSPEEVVGMRVNTFFFPDWPKLPETNRELIEYIDGRRPFFQKAQNKDLYMKIADEMIASVRATHNWMRGHIEEVHAAFNLPSTEPNHKSHYDKVDLHFIDRAELQRKDREQSTMVETQAQLAKMMAAQQAAPAMTAEQFLASMKIMLEQNSELVKEALAVAASAQAKKE
jgi:hypothetical protein